MPKEGVEKKDYYAGLNLSKEKLTEKKEWRGLFPSLMVRKAMSARVQKSISDFAEDNSWYGAGRGCHCLFREKQEDSGQQPGKSQSRQMNLRDYGYRKAPVPVSDRYETYRVSVSRAPRSLSDTWKDAEFSCSCRDGKRSMFCLHKAALMVRWEIEHGPWLIEESDAEYNLRMKKIAIARELEREDRRMEELGMEEVPAAGFFAERAEGSGLVFYDIKKILRGWSTTAYYMARAGEIRALYRKSKVLYRMGNYETQYSDDIEFKQSRDGKNWVNFYLTFEDELHTYHTGGILSPEGLHSMVSTKTDQKERYGVEVDIADLSRLPKSRVLDAAALASLKIVLDYLDSSGPLGKTDQAAGIFFDGIEESLEKTQEEAQLSAEEKRKILMLEPRIIIEDGEANLSFKIGYASGRSFVLKNMSALVGAYQAEQVLELTKKESIDFGSLEFLETVRPLLEFLIRRVGETRDVNAMLSERSRYGYYAPSLREAVSRLKLKGSLLDGFYDAAEGFSCEYQDKTNGVKGTMISVGHRDLKIRLKMERIADARDTFAGVAVSGFIPILINGRSARYILNGEALSRVSPEEVSTLEPFRRVADPSGYFRFQVGFDRLQEFYYRVLPAMLASPCVEIEDSCGEEVQNILPPEAEFTFFLDYADELVSCDCTVRYGDERLRLYSSGEARPLKRRGEGTGDEGRPGEPGPSGKESRSGELSLSEKEGQTAELSLSGKEGRTAELSASEKTGPDVSVDIEKYAYLPNDIRDIEQELRVCRVLNSLFKESGKDRGSFRQRMKEDDLFEFLLNGIPTLERYGTVQGTDAFRRQRLRPVPAITVGVSVDSGIMDLSVTSKDISEEELLELLTQYKVRKRYHRLRSGEYIDLSRNEELDSLGQLFQELDLQPTELIRKKAHIPVYRALYLDRLLEEHDALAFSRDRTFRALARNFRTVKDADFEAPQSLSETLRPYQAYAFKWLKTVESSGFGGILADEMGLGKTLEMISLLLYDKEQEEKSRSLIICPASLVYNWQEEIKRFAPKLSCAVLAGTPASRKAALADNMDVYVTSYDLARRDIALLEGDHFHICILDEAQNIKNAKAAVTKAVKGIHADHRFALTGTPIENRLSELWSIFDYLMPGFLYSYSEFEKRFEKLITKEKDEKTTEKLRTMTSPFILRRRKEEVLKDLPEKLEEVRYARVSGEQQKLYDAQVLQMKGLLTGTEGGGEEKIRIFAALTRIRQICCDPSLIYEEYHGASAKREACMELVQSAIDGGHRILIFSQFTSMLALLEEDLHKEGIEYYKIIGSTPKEKRIALVHAFNDGEVPVFLISLKAGGSGLNLTGADVVIHYDPWWNLAVQNQATDRAHRIGQTRQVNVFKLVLKDTIEERIMELQNAKKDLAEAILEGEASSIMNMSNEELLELLN